MKIRKQLYYCICALILYYALFIACSMVFSHQNERLYPLTLAAFVFLSFIYFGIFKDKHTRLFYTISSIILPIAGLILFGLIDRFLDPLNDVFLYAFQYVLFIISSILLVFTINRIYKNAFVNDEDKFIVIEGKKYFTVSILLLLFIGTIFLSINQYEDLLRYNFPERYRSTIAPDTTAKVVLAGDSPGDYDDYDEGDGEEMHVYSLEHLWGNPADDKNAIQNLILFLIDNNLSVDGQGDLERITVHLHYFVDERSDEEDGENYFESRLRSNFESEDSVNINTFLTIRNDVGRDSAKIKGVFNSYKYLFYTLMPKQIYSKTDLGNIVDILLLSYNDLNSQDDKSIEELSKALYNGKGIYFDEMNIVEKYISEEYKSAFKSIYYGNGSRVRDEDLFWAYSFWVRRYREKNVQHVYEILKEVQNYYAE